MKEPTEDLLLAYGRVAWAYNKLRVAMVANKSSEDEYITIRDDLRQYRIDLEKLQRKYDDLPYQYK